jgi:hypothetical protein
MNFSILAQLPVLVQVKDGKYRYSAQISYYAQLHDPEHHETLPNLPNRLPAAWSERKPSCLPKL